MSFFAKKLIKRFLPHKHLIEIERSPSESIAILNGFLSCCNSFFHANKWQDYDKLFLCEIDMSLMSLKSCHFDFLFMFLSMEIVLNESFCVAHNSPLQSSNLIIAEQQTEIWIKGNYCWKWQNICSIVAQDRRHLLHSKSCIHALGDNWEMHTKHLKINWCTKATPKIATKILGQEMVSVAISEAGVGRVRRVSQKETFFEIILGCSS